jgi:hypothetical protein
MALAASAISAAVIDVHDIPALGLGSEEIRVAPGSALVGRDLSTIARSGPGIFVIGLRREDRLWP